MFTDEVVTLMTIEEAGKLTKNPASRSRNITNDDIGCLCDSLVRRGHLATNSLGEYQLTLKGCNTILQEAILLVACADQGWAKDRMEKLEQLHTEIDRQIGTPIGKQQRFSLAKEYSPIS